MYRIWLLFDPRRLLVALMTVMATMVMLMHFLMLSTTRYNFLEVNEPPAAAAPAASLQSSAPSQG